jgi:PAS domain S-box-containing protein
MSMSLSELCSLKFYQTRRAWQLLATIAVSGLSFGALHFGMHHLIAPLPDDIEGEVHFIYEGMILSLCFAVTGFYLRNRQRYIEHLGSEARLKMFIKHAPAAIAMLDREMNYLVVSDRWLKDYSIQDEDIIGRNHYDIFPMIKDTPLWIEDHRRALELGETTRHEEDSFIGINGRRDWLTYEILPWRDLKGRIGGLIFYTEIVTPRMEALEKLRESEARFARAMRGSNDGLFDWDIKNDFIYYSPRFKKLLGYADNELGSSYRDWAGLLHPDDTASIKQKVEDHLYRHEPYLVEYRLRKENGEYLWIEARGYTERDEKGAPMHFSGTMIDISERKRLKGLKNEFVYVVTHELRTPLSALRGALDMLPQLLGRELPQKAEKSLDLALQGCDRLTLLVNDLLEAGRAETDQLSFEMKSCELAPLLKKSVDLNNIYGEKFGVQYHLAHDLPDCRITLDENRFLQIMANLLSNAAKFSPAGSIVEISAGLADGNAIIRVEDHGQGIPKDFRPKVFTKFARGQSSTAGTGLGLNITKTMVEKMNGRIGFESELGKGTVFFVQFPALP